MTILDTQTHSWPPPYTIRYSAKSTRVHLTINPVSGLEVVVPRYDGTENILDLLNEQKKWILKHLKRAEPIALPNQLILPAISQTWDIKYLETCNKSIRMIPFENNQLILKGNTNNTTLACRALRAFLKQMGKKYLIPWLKKLSFQSKLKFEQVAIRGQKQRWGSCSNQKSINLNYQLLFLPENLVTHVLLHELCHTKHMDHSSYFWQLLGKHDKTIEANKKALKKANDNLPGWLSF